MSLKFPLTWLKEMTEWQPFIWNYHSCSHRSRLPCHIYGIKRLSTECYPVVEYINDSFRAAVKPKEDVVKVIIYNQPNLDNFDNDYLICLPTERGEHQRKISENYLPTRKLAIGFSRPFKTWAFKSYIDLAQQIAKESNPSTDCFQRWFYFLVEEKVYLGEVQYIRRQERANPNCPCCNIETYDGVCGVSGHYPADLRFYVKPLLESLMKLEKLS